MPILVHICYELISKENVYLNFNVNPIMWVTSKLDNFKIKQLKKN